MFRYLISKVKLTNFQPSGVALHSSWCLGVSIPHFKCKIVGSVPTIRNFKKYYDPNYMLT